MHHSYIDVIEAPQRRSYAMALVLPTLLIMFITALTAAGVSVTPIANADATVEVTGSVASTIDVTPTCTNAGANGFGALLSNGSFSATAEDCAMAVTTNSLAGATLSVSDDRAGLNPAFCIEADCSTPASQLNDADAALPLNDGEFGITLTSTSGTNPVESFVANPTAGAGGAWYPVAASAAACGTSSTEIVTCNFRFGIDTKNPQNAGSYAAQVRFTGTAL